QLADGRSVLAVTVFDLMAANHGIDRSLAATVGGSGADDGATGYDQLKPYTPAWQEAITGVPAHQLIRLAREVGEMEDMARGRSMIIVGAGVNLWCQMDMACRGLHNLLVLCGCVGQSGGGWAHPVGQEKLRPQSGWTPLPLALDWNRPTRFMTGT